jgi:hypothetical protein
LGTEVQIVGKCVLKYKETEIEIEEGKSLLDIKDDLPIKNKEQLIAAYIDNILVDLHACPNRYGW